MALRRTCVPQLAAGGKTDSHRRRERVVSQTPSPPCKPLMMLGDPGTRATDATPVASIVVPSYCGVTRLPMLLDSLASQDPATADFEVIVVVDGEDDGSPALIEAETRINVRSVVFPANRGRVSALNAGFREARGEILIRCDDDLCMPPGYVRAHVDVHRAAAQRGESIGVVGKTWDVHEPSAYTRAYGSDAARRSFEFASSRPAHERWRLWAASCSLTRETWERIGPYSDAYRGYGFEDVDYGYRLMAAGVPIEVADAATAEHHGPARTTLARARKAFDSGRARSTFIAQHPEAPIASAVRPHGLWGAAVGTLAALMEATRGVGPLPRAVDAVLGALPVAVGRKLVALNVEAAGLAGEHLGRTRG